MAPTWSPSVYQPPLPAAPETLIEYLTYAADHAKLSTLTRRLSAISQAHQLAGHDSPAAHIAVRKLMAGIRRAKGTAQRGKRPITIDDLRGMLAAGRPTG